MKIQRWHLVAALALCGTTGTGCSSPFTSEDIYERLSREGISRPNGTGAPLANRSPNHDAGMPAEGVTLTDLLFLAEQANPELRSSRSAVGIAAGQAWQAGLYPNPMGYATSSEMGLEDDSPTVIVGIEQPIVIGNRLRAAVAEADAEETARLADVGRVRLEVFGRVAELHARVQSLDAQFELVDELISIGEKTLEIAVTRFQARAVAEPDVIRPRVEVHQLRADRQRIAQELAAVEKQLGLALDTDPISADRLESSISMTPMPLDEDHLAASVEAGHPALIVADREIDAAEAAIKRIRADRVPDLNLTAGVGYSEEDDQGIAEIGIGVEIPLWDRLQGDLVSARFDLMKRRSDKTATRNRLLSELADAKGAYDAAREQLRVIRDDVVPDAQRAFDLIDESYRAGRASFIDLLDAQRTLMQSRRTLIELAGRASVARARIAAISGTEALSGAIRHEIEQSSTNPTTAPPGAEKRE